MKLFSRASFICLVAICGLLTSAKIAAQSTYGTITGMVTDASGAVISGAKVETLNQATGETRGSATDSAGEYRFLNVDPGQYTITASAERFTATEDKNVVVLARETARSEIRLEVKGVQQTVVVEGSQSLVSEDLTKSTSMSGTEIGSLALNFRNSNAPSPIEAAAVSPGVSQDPGGNLTFAGQLPTATSFSLDGISIQDVRQGGPSTNLFPSVEGIAEFRVNTAGNSAEFAQPTDLTVVTRGGTNQFHGSGFWYFTNKNWNATDGIGLFNPTLSANTFGGSVDGPIIKNKLLFYFDYEGVRLDQDTLVATQTMPASWASGDFSGVPGLQLYSPAGVPVSGNKVAVNADSATIINDFFPAPAGPNAASDNIDSTGNNLNKTWPGTYSADGYDGRLDYNLSEKHHIFGRLTKHNITSTGSDATSEGALGAVGDTSYNPAMGTFSTITDATNVAVSYNWIIKNSMVNELRGGYTAYNLTFAYPQALQGNSIISALGIKGLPGPPVNGLGGVPVFYVANLMGEATNQFGHPRDQKNGIWEVGDNLSWTHGKFNSKFGGDFRRLNYQDNITFEVGDEYGDYYITGDQVCPSAELKLYPDACAAAQFVQGYLDEADQAQNGPDGKPYGYHWDFFAQTEYKLLKNLTVTVGLRDELNTPFHDASNQLGNFDYRKGSSTYGKLIYDQNEKLSPAWVDFVNNSQVNFQNQFVLNSAVGLPTSLRKLDTTNIQPRLGLSWSPKSGTVVRASGGMYSVPVLGAVLYSLLGVDTSNFGSFFPTAGAGSMTWANAYGTGSNPYSQPWSACPTSCPGYRRANQWDLKDPRVIQWNAAFEQNIGFRTVAKASYVGSHTYDLIYSPDLNQIPANTLGYWQYRAANGANFPNFREVLTRANGPSDKYDALILELNRHMGRGFTFDNAFTFTRNKTNALGAVPSGAIPVGGQGDNGDNVLNAFNISAETGNAFYDPSERFLSTVVYDIPVGRNKQFLGNVSRALDAIVGGWSTSNILLYHSGFWLTPYFPSSEADPSGTAPSYRSVKQQNPDYVAGVSGTLSNPTIGAYFNAKAYQLPSDNLGNTNDIGRFGTAGVGILQGPSTFTLSSSLGKTFHINEQVGVHYEAQFANLLNVNNWGIPNMNVGSSSFGQITNEQDGTPGSQAGPRSIQMSLRVSY
ncbi:MAG: carboxypeptidase-like regulatory domain-containing protein [Terracidiphilus sp.]